MIAASVWSLLIPAMEQSVELGLSEWVPAAAGFVMGALFLFALDKLTPHIHPSTGLREGLKSGARRTMLLISAVTLHNIPEGMAVGLAFALAAQHPGNGAMLSSAVALAIGIGIQNFPEGAAISIPLLNEGKSARRAFLVGGASGVVEPIFGLLTVLLASHIIGLMPWLLAFAAGAMIYVVVEELIPEAHMDENTHAGTFGALAGFLIMMVLDVALG
jgi:ZIP family zinc transporter